MNQPGSRIFGIVVAFHPVRESIIPLLGSLSEQVEAVILIDNTPGDDAYHLELIRDMQVRFPHLRIHRMGSNSGIGKALNHGIRIAIDAGFEFVYLSDQDSEPGKGMVDGLIDCYEKLTGKGVNVGCVCPAYHDVTIGKLFNFQAYLPGSLFYKSVPAEKARPWLEIITTITSGSLIPCHVLKATGLMREDFFIDDVDTEWCHRARSHGFRIYGTSAVLLNHRLGDEAFRFWYFGWKLHNLYSPLRLYYRFRNFILMIRLPHVPLRWSIRAGWFWLGNLYAYSLFSPNKLANIRAIAKGIFDGLRGHAGQQEGRL